MQKYIEFDGYRIAIIFIVFVIFSNWFTGSIQIGCKSTNKDNNYNKWYHTY